MADNEKLNQQLQQLGPKMREKDAAGVYDICKKYLQALVKDNEDAVAMVEQRFDSRCSNRLKKADIFSLLDDPAASHEAFRPEIAVKERTPVQAGLLTVFGNARNALFRVSFKTKKSDVRFFSYRQYLSGEDRRWTLDRDVQQDVLMHDAICGNLWCARLISARFDREAAEEMVCWGGGTLRSTQARQWGDIMLQARHALYRLGKITDREALLCSELLILGYNNDELMGGDKQEWMAFLNSKIKEDKNALREQMLLRSRYALAGELAARGKKQEAEALYAQLGDFWSSKAQLALLGCPEKKSADLQKGMTVKFGGWKQDELPALAPTFSPIAWHVLKVEGGTALLLSEKVLDAHSMADTVSSGDSWNDCCLRRWLTGCFYVKAFSPLEKQAVLSDGDPVFLLTADEAEKLLTPQQRKGTPTPWAENRDDDAAAWWLMPTEKDKKVIGKRSGSPERQASDEAAGVRPAIRVDVNKLTALLR